MPRKARRRIPESSDEEEEEEEENLSRLNNRRLLPMPRQAASSDNGSDYEEHGHNRRASSRSRPPHRLKGLDKPTQPNGYYVDSVDESESVDEEENVPNVTPSKPPESIRIGSHISKAAPITPNLPSPAPYPTAPYMNVAPMPVFHGKSSECSVKHLSRFRKVCHANNVLSDEAMMRIFPVTLEDEAALWYDLNIEPCPLLTWEEIKLAFVQAYQSVELLGQSRSELTALTQGADETVRSYFLRMQWILKMWPGGRHYFPDELLKDIFVDGLREGLRELTGLQNPDSLDEALRLAFHYEHVKGMPKGEVELKCTFCGGPHEEIEGCEVRQRMRELWVRISEGESGSISVRDGTMNTSQCRCWKHQCWKKKLERSNSSTTAADTETPDD